MDLLLPRRVRRRPRRPPRRRLRPVTVGCPAALLAVVAALSLLAGARPAAAAAGAYGWPVAPHRVVRGFEAPTSAWGPGHRGVDLAAPGGSLVLAAGAGTVSFAAVLAGRGVVVVTHAGGLRTTYEPVTASVRVGAHVARGDPIGRLALAESHCLPRACLHWGALRGSTYLDPLTLLGLAPGSVRLLPLGPEGDSAPAPLPLAAGPPEVRWAGGAAVRVAPRGATLLAAGDETRWTTSSRAAARASPGGAAVPASGGAASGDGAAVGDPGAAPARAPRSGASDGAAPRTAGGIAALAGTGLVAAGGVAGSARVRRAGRRDPSRSS